MNGRRALLAGSVFTWLLASKTTPEKIAESVSKTGFKASVKSAGDEARR